MMNDLHSYEYHNLARKKVPNYILLSIHQVYPNVCHEVMNRIRKYCTSKDEKEPYQA